MVSKSTCLDTSLRCDMRVAECMGLCCKWLMILFSCLRLVCDVCFQWAPVCRSISTVVVGWKRAKTWCSPVWDG
jgi:hypothetical protein